LRIVTEYCGGGAVFELLHQGQPPVELVGMGMMGGFWDLGDLGRLGKT